MPIPTYEQTMLPVLDGVIDEDRLGLDTIYIQAKRWENPVSRPEIQKFAGALQGQRAKKGIFTTSSSFTRDALDLSKESRAGSSSSMGNDSHLLCLIMTLE